MPNVIFLIYGSAFDLFLPVILLLMLEDLFWEDVSTVMQMLVELGHVIIS